jgi:hypothetical protein
MDERLEMTVVHYATMVLEWLDIDAKHHKASRPQLVEMFIDTLQALEQNRSQED